MELSPDGRELTSVSWNYSERWLLDKTGTWQQAQCQVPPVNLDISSLDIIKSPDGKLLVSLNEVRDEILELWRLDEAGRSRVATLRGHIEPVYSVAWSPDAKQLASGSRDKTVRLWFVDTAGQRQPGQVLRGHTNSVMSVAWSLSGKQLASGSCDYTVRLWFVDDAGRWQPGMVLKGHTSLVWSVVWSPVASGGKQLASGSHDKTVRLWIVCKYDDRTHSLFAPAFRAWIALLVCMFERVVADAVPLEVWLLVFQQMAALLED